MTVGLTQTSSPPTDYIDYIEDEWTPPEPPKDLIFDDGEPLESNRHRIAMNVLIEAVHRAYQGRNDYFVGGNMFIYFSDEKVFNRDFRGPDFFVTLNVDGEKERQGWVTWQEGGRYPDVIIELMSPSTANQDLTVKKQLYQDVFRTRNYFVYDPFNAESLQGWRLGVNLTYESISPNQEGKLWSDVLGLWLGVWHGKLTKENAPWLRFFAPDGNLVLLSQELAELEKQRADQEKQRADQEKQRADQEKLRADQAELALRELQNRLQQMGIDLPQ